MAFPPRPPLMSGVPVSAMVGPPFTLATVRIPMTMSQSLSSIPTPMGGRPPLRPMGQPNPPMPSMPPMPPMPPMSNMPPRLPMTAPNSVAKPPSYSQRIESSGPAVTVFVGNITERAPDVMIRHILNACGQVLSWKRVQGASGKLQGFGFCEYGNPDAALRAIRLLHNYEIATNKMVVKADSKTTEILDEYKEKRRKAHQEQENGDGNGSPLQDENKPTEECDYLDNDMKEEDKQCLARVASILSDHKKDIVNYIAPQYRQDLRDKRMTRVQEKLVALSSGADLANIPSTLNLDDMEDVEDGKKELISREITQFREQMKKQEEEKERERKLREKDKERERDRDRDRDRDRGDRNRDRERDWERERERDRERRDREERRKKSRSKSRSDSVMRRSRSTSVEVRKPSRKDKHRSTRSRRNSRSKSRSHSVIRRSRSVSVEVTRSSKKEKHRGRSRSHSPSKKNDKEVLKEREKDAEEKERKEQERKVRKKEMQYQERLKNWEAREHKKQKELDREADKERQKENETERDARRLKEFLEDYDDERDDPKFYKGQIFQRKVVEREREKELDQRDRVKEKEELEELRMKILQEGHDNPDEAFEQACAEREEQYKPKLLLKPAEKPPTPPLIDVAHSPSPVPQPPVEQQPVEPQIVSQPESDDDDDRHSDAPPEPIVEDHEENSLSQDAFSSAETTPVPPKRKKLDVKDVFNQEDDDDTPRKKKKLPLPGKEKVPKEKGGEEKRKHIKSLIDKIPTSKEELFAFPIDSSLVDNVLMEKRIRPWINKKIIEYIGEPEPTLVEFICSKVLLGSEPQSLLNDVQMVLDDEAEVFVVKMWRLLIYEIEAKKMGLGKT